MGTFAIFIIVGFVAQLIDGALGMAYGVINMSLLLSIGIAPSAASAVVHTSEIFTTGISGFSHAMFKNVHKELFFRIMIPGVLGSISGAYLLTLLPVSIIKPAIAIYLIVVGAYILYKSFESRAWWQRMKEKYKKFKQDRISLEKYWLISFGFGGGFFDAFGGGGWGAFVTTSLIAQGIPPRYTIGSVILAEFLVAIASSLTFYATIGISHWPIILGLVTGGVLAAPFAAFMTKKIPSKILMRLVGSVVILVSIRMIVELFTKDLFQN